MPCEGDVPTRLHRARMILLDIEQRLSRTVALTEQSGMQLLDVTNVFVTLGRTDVEIDAAIDEGQSVDQLE